MMWVWIALALVAVAFAAYLWKVRQARLVDVLDAQRAAMADLRRGTGIQPDDS